jgi:hypothetical protein
MPLTFYVLAYEVTTFLGDNPVRYLVIDGRGACSYPGACKHVAQSDMLTLARQEVMAAHKNQIGCGKGNTA